MNRECGLSCWVVMGLSTNSGDNSQSDVCHIPHKNFFGRKESTSKRSLYMEIYVPRYISLMNKQCVKNT